MTSPVTLRAQRWHVTGKSARGGIVLTQRAVRLVAILADRRAGASGRISMRSTEWAVRPLVQTAVTVRPFWNNPWP
jgi:hypothetical protein